MVQLTIDFLLKPKSIDNYFYIKWQSRYEPEEYPFFCSKVETKICYGFLNRLLHLPFILVGDVKKRRDKLQNKIEYEDIGYENVHFLKSHLQKCIRRCETSLAIQTARHLIDLDPVQFLRRLSIIIVEDTIITKHYSVLIWLLIAVSSNRLVLGLNHKEWLLGLVYVVSEGRKKDRYVGYPVGLSDEKLAKYVVSEMVGIEREKYAVIMSLIIRASYGGMSGDMTMLLRAAYVWMKRFVGDYEDEYYNIELRTISYSVYPLQKGEWLLSAIDFHCFPKMIVWIVENNEMDEQEVKRLIWHCSSKINAREKNSMSEGDRVSWMKIRKNVESIAKYAISKFS